MYGRLVSVKGFEMTTAPTTIVVTNIPAPGGERERGKNRQYERGEGRGANKREGESLFLICPWTTKQTVCYFCLSLFRIRINNYGTKSKP